MDQLRTSPDALLTELKDGTGVLLQLRTKFYYSLNRTGVVAWKLVAERRAGTEAALAAELAARFKGISPEAARLDLAVLVRELVEEDLLLPLAGEPPADR